MEVMAGNFKMLYAYCLAYQFKPYVMLRGNGTQELGMRSWTRIPLRWW